MEKVFTELGVASIQPLLAARSVLALSGERAHKRVAHWQAIAFAACEQSGRTAVPGYGRYCRWSLSCNRIAAVGLNDGQNGGSVRAPVRLMLSPARGRSVIALGITGHRTGSDRLVVVGPRRRVDGGGRSPGHGSGMDASIPGAVYPARRNGAVGPGGDGHLPHRNVACSQQVLRKSRCSGGEAMPFLLGSGCTFGLYWEAFGASEVILMAAQKRKITFVQPAIHSRLGNYIKGEGFQANHQPAVRQGARSKPLN